MSEISAYHEAGHAFMAVYVGARVRSVTVDPDWDDGPERYADIQIEWPLARFTDRELHEKSVLVALAGPVAEMIHSGEPYHPGFVAEWAADWKLAWESAAVLFPAERKRLAYLEQTSVRLYRLLDREDHWAALAAIVDHLLAHETLAGEEVEDILRQWLR
jgi:ATP-dependent Zn protease